MSNFGHGKKVSIETWLNRKRCNQDFLAGFSDQRFGIPPRGLEPPAYEAGRLVAAAFPKAELRRGRLFLPANRIREQMRLYHSEGYRADQIFWPGQSS